MKQPHPSALAQAVPPPMVLSIGRNPADARKLAQTSRNAVHPTTILSDFNHLLNALMPPSHVAMGGQQHQTGVGMVPNPEQIAARFGISLGPLVAKKYGMKQLIDSLSRTVLNHPTDEMQGPFSIADEALHTSTKGGHVPGHFIYGTKVPNADRMRAMQRIMDSGVVRNPHPPARLGEHGLRQGAINAQNEQLNKAAQELQREHLLERGAMHAEAEQNLTADTLRHERLMQQMPWMTEPSLNLRQWMMDTILNKGGQPHPLLQPTVPGGTDTQKALLDFFIQNMKGKHPTK